MKKSWRLVSLTATVIGLMALCQDLLAQDAAPLFRERFANVFDPESRTYFSLQGTEGKQFGGQQPYASLGATHYTGSIEDAVTLYSGQFMMNYNAITGNPAGTLGAQQRWLLNLPLLDRSILGAGLYLDFSQSRYNNLFQQLNVNLELYTESAWLARGNLYLPVGQNQQYTGLSSVSGGAPGQLSVVGTTVGTGGTIHQWMDVALMGTDLELGRKLFNYRMEVYGSYYTWNGPLAGFTNGAKAGVRGYLTNNLSGNLNVSHDQFFGTNVYSGVTYFFGGSGGNRPMSFENLMTLPAQRSQQVSISNYSRNQDTFRALHDKITGDELHLYFVKEDGTGLGTQVNPSNVTAVEGNSHFGAGSAMVLLDANGNITTPVTLAHDRQQLVGGGSTGTADIDFSLALGEPAGTSVVHLSNLGGRPVLAPPSGNAVNLSANQTVIKGFTIDGAGGLTAGVVGLPQISDTVINDLLVRNVNGVGIQLDPAKHSSVTNITFNNNGTDLVLSDSNSTTNTISNITSTGAKNGSLMLGHGAFGLTGTTNVSNVTISGAGGFGGIEINNAKSGSTTNLNNISITGGTGSGVTVANSQTGSLYNLTNVDILRTGNTGISLLNSNGTFNVDNGSSIANTGSAGLDVNGGAIDVNFNGSITQTLSDASAVYATGSHTGTVIFGTGSSIHTTIGNGLQFDSADGTYKFLGSITMNGGDAGFDIFNSNGNFTFNNPFINNTASGMAVKIVGGGGDAPITTFNGLSITTNSNTGFFVANGGLTTVNGTANVDTKFGTAVDLSGTALATVFTNIKSDQSPTSGIRIDNATGTFGVTGNATVTGAAGSGISITNSHTLSTGLQKVTINSIGTSGADNGITLSDAGTVTILGGTINGTTGDGIHSSDTNLSVVGVNIGGLSAVNGDGVEIINNGSPHLINLGGNTIKGNASGVSTRDSGVAGELVLLLNQNTLESVNSGSLALSVLGGGLNSTIIQSMSGDTVIGNGTGGGVLFNQVTFDASGSSLSGTQVNAGNWTIGTPAGRVHGDGLHFDAPTGNLKFGTLNIANNGGDGLFVDAKTLGTTFTLSNTGGTIDTTSGSALNLDPLTANLTFSSVSSTGSAGNGITLNTVSGSLNIGALTVSSAAGNGVDMSNSSATVGIGQLNINGAVEGVNLLNNTGSFTVNTGGTIQNVTDRGVLAVNTVSTSLNNMTIDATGGTRGVGVLTTSGNNTFRLTNSTVLGGSEQAMAVGADGAGVLTAVINGNTLTGTANNPQGAGFVGITSATGASGGTLNLIFNGNTLSSVASAGAYISDYNPNTSTTGGTVTIAGFANNTVTTSNAGNASTPLTGGILVNGATFDGDLLTAGIQAVNGK